MKATIVGHTQISSTAEKVKIPYDDNNEKHAGIKKAWC